MKTTVHRPSGWIVAAMIMTAWDFGHVAGQSWRTVTTSRQLTAEEEVFVDVEYGVGRFAVRPGETGSLYRMELRYDEEVFEPVSEYRGNRLTVGVETIGKGISIGKGDRSGQLDLELATEVPLHLNLEFGAVRADLDLGGIALLDLDLTTGASDSRVDVSEPNPVQMDEASFEVGAASFAANNLGNLNAERIAVNAGVGDIILDFTGDWRRDADVAVHLGLGSVELRFPRGLGVRLIRDTFLTSLDAPGLVRRDGDYYSADWESADRRVTLEIEAKFGSIDVVWIE